MNPITLFIPTYGKWHFTSVCLEFALRGLEGAELDEILIVNTRVPPWEAEEDDTEIQLEKIQQVGAFGQPAEKFRIMTLEENLGPTLTFNHGIELAKNMNDVVILNNDIFLAENWLEPLIRCAYAPHHESLVAWVGPYLAPEICLDPMFPPDFRKHYLEQVHSQFVDCRTPAQVKHLLHKFYQGNFFKFGAEFVQRNQGKLYDQVHGGCALIKRSAIDAGIGTCDPDFAYTLPEYNGNKTFRFGRGSDDIDMWIRITNAEKFTVMCFESFGHHVVNGSSYQRGTKLYGDGDPFILNGNRLIKKWELTNEEIVYPFELAGSKLPHRKFRPRQTPLPSHTNIMKVNWGLGDEIGFPYMINKLGGIDRTEVFPL